jgi:hypothetical protein
VFAYGQFLSFEENVKFDVLALTLVFPRVFAVFQPYEPPITFGGLLALVKVAFKTRGETSFEHRGER